MIFIWTRTYRQIFKSALVCLNLYRSTILIVIPRLCVVKTHSKGAIETECFATYEFPTLLLHFLTTRVEISSQANYQTLKKRSAFWVNKKIFSLLKKYRIQRMMLMVDSYRSSNVCTMKTVNITLMHGRNSLSKVINFPLLIVLQFLLNPKWSNYARFYWHEHEFLQGLRDIKNWN